MTKISRTNKNSANNSGVYVLSAISISRIDKISAKKSADFVCSANYGEDIADKKINSAPGYDDNNSKIAIHHEIYVMFLAC